jgi:hypothetical protein
MNIKSFFKALFITIVAISLAYYFYQKSDIFFSPTAIGKISHNLIEKISDNNYKSSTFTKRMPAQP